MTSLPSPLSRLPHGSSPSFSPLVLAPSPSLWVFFLSWTFRTMLQSVLTKSLISSPPLLFPTVSPLKVSSPLPFPHQTFSPHSLLFPIIPTPCSSLPRHLSLTIYTPHVSEPFIFSPQPSSPLLSPLRLCCPRLESQDAANKTSPAASGAVADLAGTRVNF